MFQRLLRFVIVGGFLVFFSLIFGGAAYFFIYSSNIEPAHLGFVSILFLAFLAFGIGMMFRIAKTLSSTSNRISMGDSDISFDSIEGDVQFSETNTKDNNKSNKENSNS